MKSAMYHTIMTWKIVICYLSKLWKKPRMIIQHITVRGQGGQAGIVNIWLPVTEKFKHMVRTIKNFPLIIA